MYKFQVHLATRTPAVLPVCMYIGMVLLYYNKAIEVWRFEIPRSVDYKQDWRPS